MELFHTVSSRGTHLYTMGVSSVRTAFILSLVCLDVFTARSADARLPFKPARGRGRVNHRQTGCQLGDVNYRLQATWNPTLEPLGPMYCVHCKCRPVIKKGELRPHGKVHCRSIKRECPRLTCRDAYTPPKSCCKVCPGTVTTTTSKNTKLPAIFSPKMNDRKEETSQGQLFTALLLGQTLYHPKQTRAVARGHFILSPATINYAIHYKGIRKPKTIRFTDEKGRVFFEQAVHNVAMFSHQICGVWRNVPSIYINYLQQGKLHFIVATDGHKDGLLGGAIGPHQALQLEAFSSLLVSDNADGNGGVAMVTLGQDGHSLNFNILFRGLLTPSDGAVARIIFSKNSNIIKEIGIKVSNKDKEIRDVWSKLTPAQSKQLARGKITLRIVTSSGRKLEGKITPKMSCSTFQAVLSGRDALKPHNTFSAGSAILYLQNNGNINYQIRLTGIKSEITSITIEGAPNKRDRRRRVTKMTGDYKADNTESLDGWANGTYTKPNAREIFLLLRQQLYVNVATRNNPISELRGHITELSYHGHLARHIGHPIVMSGSSLQPPVQSGIAGHVWFNVDLTCSLHYEIIIGGLTQRNLADFSVVLNETTSGRPFSVILKRFYNNKALGVMGDLPEDFFYNLNFGNTNIKLTSKQYPNGAIGSNVTVPNQCYSKTSRRNNADILEDMENNQIEDDRYKKCSVDGSLYDDGESWVPKSVKTCATCSCHRGKTICHPTVCPPLSCKRQVKLPGECCPSCQGRGKQPAGKCFFQGDKRNHSVGTIWYPYVAPFGYSTCAICSCVPGKNEYNCSRIRCPRLNCPGQEVRLRGTDCCKVCQKLPEINSNVPAVISNVQQDGPKKGACLFAGKKYDNLQEWNPLTLFGAVKCVTCKCRNGKAKCKRLRCKKLHCKRKTRPSGSCCRVCADGKRGRDRKDRRKKNRKRKNKHRKNQ
uniref:Chordin n=1 Tax=Terebratalia transversa TaxID=34513 RepID=A0A165USK3_TERTR|nr:chordin [Terebratalia transversa]